MGDVVLETTVIERCERGERESLPEGLSESGAKFYDHIASPEGIGKRELYDVRVLLRAWTEYQPTVSSELALRDAMVTMLTRELLCRG